MTEFNFNEERKKYQEFITPQYIRDIIKKDLGDVSDKVLFDCACGSGQLLLNVDCKKKIGCEINPLAFNYAVKNLDEVYNHDYITFDDSNINYDIVVANPPFSLRADVAQLNHLNSKYLFQFEKINKVLDQWFVIKSFEKAEKGYYILFPGLQYRIQEELFRRWLVENNYIEKIAIIQKSQFENTNIAIMYLVLNKHKKDTKVIRQEYETGKLVNEAVVDINDFKELEYNLSYNFPKPPKPPVDIKKLNLEIYEDIINTCKKELLSQIVISKHFPDDFDFFTMARIRKDLEDIIKSCEEIK